MSAMITAFHYDLGGREVYEDRVRAETVMNRAGLKLDVAVVADGVGGRDRGERAAQIAVDVIFRLLQESNSSDIPGLLTQIIQQANHMIYQEGQRNPTKFQGASTTLSMAVVVNNQRLYIANVGDSQVYLYRDGKLIQLSLDHTFANMMPIQGKMSVPEARQHPRAGVVMRALGPRPQTKVDIGLYANTTDMKLAEKRGRSGIQLKMGDSILVCSDGLTKIARTGSPYVTEDEIIRVLMNQEGEKAARSLVSFALGRDADDNVSAAIIQTVDPSRTKRMQDEDRETRRRQTMITGGIVGAVVLIAAIIIGFFIRSGQQTTAQATAEAETLLAEQTRFFEDATAEAVYAEQAIAQTIAAYTPTPTPLPTLTPTPFILPEAGQVAVAFVGPERIVVRERESVASGDLPLQLQINHTGGADFKDASLYGFPQTALQVREVTNTSANLILEKGSQVFIETGAYPNGVEINFDQDSQLSSFVFGSCMAADYGATTNSLRLSCFEGTCGYFNIAEQNIIPEGTFVEVDLADLTHPVLNTGELSLEQVLIYDTFLRGVISGDGVLDADTCLARFIPTPTPEPTATIVIPTRTPRPTAPSLYGGEDSGFLPPPGGDLARQNGQDSPPPSQWGGAFFLLTVLGLLTSIQIKSHHTKRKIFLAAGVIGAFMLAVYGMTLAPSVVGYDSAELVTGAYTLGIVHPSGYPLFLLLGKLFTLLPAGDVAYRVNLMTAVFSALTISGLYLTAFSLTRHVLAAALAALMLGLSPYFWSMSVVAEVYTLNTLVTIGAIYFLLAWRENQRNRFLYAGIFCAGLGMANHVSVIFLAPAVAYLFWEQRHRLSISKMANIGLLAITPLLLYLYLPLRYMANPSLNYVADYYDVNLTTFRGVLWMISGEAYHIFATGYSAADLLREAWLFMGQLIESFTPAGFALGLIGLGVLLYQKRSTAVFLLLIFCAHTAFYVNYNVIDKHTMFLPSFLIWALWLAVGLRFVLEQARQRINLINLRAAGPVLASLPLLFLFWTQWPQNDLSQNQTNVVIAQTIMAEAPSDAVLVADWSTSVVLEYYQLVEAQRTDLKIINRSRYQVATYYDHWKEGEKSHEEILSAIEQEEAVMMGGFSTRPVFQVVSELDSLYTISAEIVRPAALLQPYEAPICDPAGDPYGICLP